MGGSESRLLPCIYLYIVLERVHVYTILPIDGYYTLVVYVGQRRRSREFWRSDRWWNSTKLVAFLWGGGALGHAPLFAFFHHRNFFGKHSSPCVSTSGQRKFAPFEILNTPLCKTETIIIGSYTACNSQHWTRSSILTMHWWPLVNIVHHLPVYHWSI